MPLLRIKIIGTEDTQQKLLMHNVKEALNQLGLANWLPSSLKKSRSDTPVTALRCGIRRNSLPNG